MKALKLILGSVFIFFTVYTEAQVSVGIGIGTPPPWGPVGYADVRYYYLPDIEAYFDINTSLFIYFNGSTWINSPSLPPQYVNYNLYNGYKVVITDYHGPTPYVYFNEHRQKYVRGYHGTPQKTYKQENEQRHGNPPHKGRK